MGRKLIPILLLVAGACTARPSPAPMPTPSGPKAATSLQLELGPSQYVGSLRASGFVLGPGRSPLKGVMVRASLTQLSGSGTLATYTATGVVPAGSATAS